jgi:hypothetical protein
MHTTKRAGKRYQKILLDIKQEIYTFDRDRIKL